MRAAKLQNKRVDVDAPVVPRVCRIDQIVNLPESETGVEREQARAHLAPTDDPVAVHEPL